MLARYRAVIFVHGCFWHGHDCPLFRWPKSRAEFWRAKIGRNIERDQEVQETIRKEGWRALTVWECAFRGKSTDAQDRALDQVAGWIAGDHTLGEIRGADSGAG